MLLLSKIKNYKHMIAIGQILMVVSILFSTISFLRIIDIRDFWLGLLEGMGMTLIVISVILNVRGILMYRKEKQQATLN